MMLLTCKSEHSLLVQVVLVVKKLPANAGAAKRQSLIPGSGRSPGGRNSNSLQFSLEKEMATHSSILAWRIPWTEEPSRLQFMGSQESDITWDYLSFFLSSILSWDIPWTEEPGGLQSMGSQRVRDN